MIPSLQLYVVPVLKIGRNLGIGIPDKQEAVLTTCESTNFEEGRGVHFIYAPSPLVYPQDRRR